MLSYLVSEYDATKKFNTTYTNLNNPEKQVTVAIMEGEFYRKDNQCMYSSLKKACKKLGPPWVARYRACKYRKYFWKSIKDFYYSRESADDRKVSYETQLINSKYQNKNRLPFDKLFELL